MSYSGHTRVQTKSLSLTPTPSTCHKLTRPKPNLHTVKLCDSSIYAYVYMNCMYVVYTY